MALLLHESPFTSEIARYEGEAQIKAAEARPDRTAPEGAHPSHEGGACARQQPRPQVAGAARFALSAISSCDGPWLRRPWHETLGATGMALARSRSMHTLRQRRILSQRSSEPAPGYPVKPPPRKSKSKKPAAKRLATRLRAESDELGVTMPKIRRSSAGRKQAPRSRPRKKR
jgi:hypothetical protein